MRKSKVALFFLMAIASSGYGSGKEGSGGDPLAQQFVSHGYRMLEELNRRPLKEVRVEKFQKTLLDTRVAFEDKLELDGVEVGAICRPDLSPKTIFVSRRIFRQMSAADVDLKYFAFHEYVKIMGLDDTNYRLTRQSDPSLVCQRSGFMRRVLENQINKDCQDITPADLEKITEITTSSTKRNEITYTAEIPASEFRYLRNLGWLHLSGKCDPNSHCTVSKIPAGLFQDLANLASLTFTNTDLTELKASDLVGLTSVSWLTFDANKISKIEAGTFDKLAPSEESRISLQGNLLKQVPQNVFKFKPGNRNVTLNLEGNPILDFTPGDFSGLLSLTVGFAKQSAQVVHIAAGAFTGVQGVILSFSDLGAPAQNICFAEGALFGLTSVGGFRIAITPSSVCPLPKQLFKKDGTWTVQLENGNKNLNAPEVDIDFSAKVLDRLHPFDFLFPTSVIGGVNHRWLVLRNLQQVDPARLQDLDRPSSQGGYSNAIRLVDKTATEQHIAVLAAFVNKRVIYLEGEARRFVPLLMDYKFNCEGMHYGEDTALQCVQ